MRPISNNFDSTPEDDSSNRWEYTPPSSGGGGGQASNVDYSLIGLIEVPEAKNYLFCIRSPITGVIQGLDYKLSGGSLTGHIKINSNIVSGLNDIAIGTSQGYVSGYYNNTFDVGDSISLDVSETANATDFSFVIRI